MTMMRCMKAYVAAAALIASMASAQETETSESPWTVSCNGKSCSVGLVAKAADTTFVTVSLMFDEAGAEPALVLTTPLGVATEPGVRVIVGESEWDLPIKVCLPDGCRAFRALDPVAVDELLQSETMDVRYFTFGGPDEPLSGVIPLKGLEDAISDLRK